MKRKVLIGQLMPKHQDHPLGANMMIVIGKVRISMQHIYILILGHHCPCRGYLPMLMKIRIHHRTCMIQGHSLHLILDHITNIMQLQEDQCSSSSHMFKTIPIKIIGTKLKKEERGGQESISGQDIWS